MYFSNDCPWFIYIFTRLGSAKKDIFFCSLSGKCIYHVFANVNKQYDDIEQENNCLFLQTKRPTNPNDYSLYSLGGHETYLPFTVFLFRDEISL